MKKLLTFACAMAMAACVFAAEAPKLAKGAAAATHHFCQHGSSVSELPDLEESQEGKKKKVLVIHH